MERDLSITLSSIEMPTGTVFADEVKPIVAFRIELLANKKLLEKYRDYPEISLDVLNEFIKTRG